jgi:hypothetical protein
MKLVGKHLKTAEKVQKVISNLPEPATILCIDPASRSLGYAIYSSFGGEWAKMKSGTITAKGDINTRLGSMAKDLKELGSPDAVFVEFIGGSTGHKYLLWAVGMVATTFPHVPLVEVQTGLWKKFVDKHYTKTDEMDAIYIGKAVLEISK